MTEEITKKLKGLGAGMEKHREEKTQRVALAIKKQTKTKLRKSLKILI